MLRAFRPPGNYRLFDPLLDARPSGLRGTDKSPLSEPLTLSFFYSKKPNVFCQPIYKMRSYACLGLLGLAAGLLFVGFVKGEASKPSPSPTKSSPIKQQRRFFRLPSSAKRGMGLSHLQQAAYYDLDGTVSTFLTFDSTNLLSDCCG